MSNFIHFQFVSIEPVDKAAAVAYQTSKGYNPMGYGFYAFECSREISKQDGKEYFVAKWKCGSSCD